ncbi:MAG: hypothetical protein L3K10_00485 [Thermoplasmata archaeon]|nr:hypothetical protein [Thermoplasmata archaeon]
MAPSEVEIPVLAEVATTLSKGDFAGAVSHAYHRVILDLQRAYGLSLPAQWTHREFLRKYLRRDMGPLPALVGRFYGLYEPVRYGTEADWVRSDLQELLAQIYTEPPLRGLYTARVPVPPTDTGDSTESPSRPDDVASGPTRVE